MAKFPFKNVLEGTKHFWTKSQGPDAEGAAVTANPLTIGYKNASGNATGVTPTEALPVGDATAQAKLADILTKLSADPATQTTLAQILAKIIAAPATEAKQDTIIGHVDGVEGTLTALNGKDFATQTTLAAILNKIIAAPATEAKQTALNALIGEVQAAPTANTLLARLKSLEDKINEITAGTTPANVQLSGSKVIPILLLSTLTSISAGTILDLDTLVDLSNIGNNGHGVSVFIGNGANDNELPIEVYVKYYFRDYSIGLRDRSIGYTTVYAGTGAAHFFSFVPVYPKFKLSIKNTHPSVLYNIGNVIVQSGL